LSKAQCTAIAAEMVSLLQVEAKQRSLANLRHGAPDPANLPDRDSSNQNNDIRGESRHVAAKAMGVGARTVQTALKVKKEDPAEFERVKRGEVTLGSAYRKVVRQEAQPKQPIVTVPGKRQQMLQQSAKKKLVHGLSMWAGSIHSPLRKTGVPAAIGNNNPNSWREQPLSSNNLFLD
jgi:hypothetical protein